MDNNSYKIPSNKKPFSPVMKKLIFLVVFAIILLQFKFNLWSLWYHLFAYLDNFGESGVIWGRGGLSSQIYLSYVTTAVKKSVVK